MLVFPPVPFVLDSDTMTGSILGRIIQSIDKIPTFRRQKNFDCLHVEVGARGIGLHDVVPVAINKSLILRELPMPVTVKTLTRSSRKPCRNFLNAFFLGIFIAGFFGVAAAQAPEHSKKVVPVDRNAAGDAPDDPGPLATNLSAAIQPRAISAVMKKVADWELTVAEPSFNQQWTFAALYDGLLAASATTGDAKYRNAVLRMSQRYNWQLLD
ncbi:MAG TPA: hypothetical protein VFE22_11105, partial [Edaphobacter sp.]|nr:hypothetical protein [Edaphobacter sp.]